MVWKLSKKWQTWWKTERKAYFWTGRRCPQGTDLAFTKPTRDAFNMLHWSFERTKSFLSENNLQHIAEDIFFPSFTTLHVEHFFAGIRTASRPTPDMYDNASRRPSCIIEAVQKVYNPSFSMYTGPQKPLHRTKDWQKGTWVALWMCKDHWARHSWARRQCKGKGHFKTRSKRFEALC